MIGQPENAWKIISAVEDVYNHVNKKIKLDKALGIFIERLQSDIKVSARSNSNLLLNAWESYKIYKSKLTKEVSQETWDTEY